MNAGIIDFDSTAIENRGSRDKRFLIAFELWKGQVPLY
jgi:hypothetical protein